MNKEIKNLYLDFNLNKMNLQRAAKMIKKAYPHIFDMWMHNEDELEFLKKIFFTNGGRRRYYIFNTSLKHNTYDLTLRPLITKDISHFLNQGISIAIRGHLSRERDFLIIDRLSYISDCEQREYEQLIEVNTIVPTEDMKNISIANSLITNEFLNSLPFISRETQKNLVLWREYLDWKETLIKNKLIGIKYINITVKKNNIVFTLVFSSEKEFIKIKGFLIKNDLRAFSNNYSSNRFNFDFNMNSNYYELESAELGEFSNNIIEEGYINQLKHIKLAKSAGQEIRKEFATPYIVDACFKIPEEYIEEGLDYESIVYKYPKEGFISISSIGDFVLINRQRKILDEIERGYGYSPNLSSWLFDIKKANSDETDNIKVDKWLSSNLNKYQKLAVNKLLNSKDIFLIQGPPGTGKTTVITEAIYQLTKRGKRILLASQANLAVDNVFERIELVPEIRAIRLGANKKISEDGKKFGQELILEEYYKSIAVSLEDGEKQENLNKKILRLIENNLDEVRELETSIKLFDNVIEKAENKIRKKTKLNNDIDNILNLKSTGVKERQILTQNNEILTAELNLISKKKKKTEISRKTANENLEHILSNINSEDWITDKKDIADFMIRKREEIRTYSSKINIPDERKRDFIYKWKNRLQDKKLLENDKANFIDTYIRNCNVVGISCTENKRTLENNDLNNFDVAIIDEVSKATPPELLLVMNRAKQVVLVGDHRQLPPVFNEHEQSYQDLIGDDDKLLTLENFEKYKTMVTSSLFKDYFENASSNIKQSLIIQYRMHRDIMGLINCFYENRLECGVKERDHQLNILGEDQLPFIDKNKHAIWIDSSYDIDGNEVYEIQNRTSKVNELEAQLIIKTLLKLEEEYSKLGYNEANLKDVGIISFYGKQISLIRKLANKHKFKSISIDINTVDRFQGKEKSIILVSLVRNIKNKNFNFGGHVASFERINVAFSRAKDLLMIFGAVEMYKNINIKLPYMETSGYYELKVYGNIIDKIRFNGALFDCRKLVSDHKGETYDRE